MLEHRPTRATIYTKDLPLSRPALLRLAQPAQRLNIPVSRRQLLKTYVLRELLILALASGLSLQVI